MVPSAPLKELCELIVDCPHSTPVWTNSGVVVLRNQNIRNGRLSLDSPSYTDEEHYRNRTKRAAPQTGDIVITREAPMGEVCMIPKGLRCCLGQRMVLLRPNSTVCHNGYLLYALQSKAVQYEIRVNEGTGSTVSNLRIPLLENLPIPIRSLPEQRAIASILGSLDDKIELNRRMNETLEGIARALFKSWFVDFDPVRAKMDGRQPAGMSPEIANLFPSEFEHVNGRLIPSSWRTGPILDIADLLSGGTPKTSVREYWGGNIPWASAKDVSQCGNAFLIETERAITQAGLDKSATKLIEPLTTVVVARGATTGRLTMFGEAIAMNQTCYALRSKFETNLFLYCHARNFMADLVNSAHGSVFDTITTRTFETTSVLLPDRAVASAFERAVAGMFERIRSNLIQETTLARLRDSLLPKLLSGELRVPEADKMLEEVL